MKDVRIARSFIAADSLAELIAEDYELPGPITCKLFSKMLRTQDNDHYLVTTAGGGRAVARVYQQGDRLERQQSDYLYELDWLAFLKERDLPVSWPLARRDGSYLGQLAAPEGPRYYALFSFAAGDPPSLRNLDQIAAVGESMARMHVASDAYAPRYEHRPWDLRTLVDRPLELIRNNWSDARSENLDLVVTAAEEARQELEPFIEAASGIPGAWGPIGGDFHQNSVNFSDDTPTFFNFDLCGPGWRAYDIAVFLANSNLIHAQSDRSEAFFAGYYAARPLSDEEHKAIAPFLTVRRVWLMGAFAQQDGMVGHTFVGAV